jgi:hypothetical protein
MPEMNETQRYILIWSNEAGGIRATLSNHDLPESDPGYGEPENTPLRAYTRDQLRITDWIVTSADQVRALVTRATPEEPIAVPISTVRELDWFPDARYRGIEI